MKKLFLLSLLSVLFLSAFCQLTSRETTEIIAKVNILRSADFSDDSRATFQSSGPIVIEDELEADLQLWPRWWFLYKRVYTFPIAGGYIIKCEGHGFRLCWLRPWVLTQNLDNSRGADVEAIEGTYSNFIAESENLAADGMYYGSITKKVAIADQYYLFQMNWDYDKNNPYNGRAEITISKTTTLGPK